MSKDTTIKTTETLLEEKPLGGIARNRKVISDETKEVCGHIYRLFKPNRGITIVRSEFPYDQDLKFPEEFARCLTAIYADEPEQQRVSRRKNLNTLGRNKKLH